MYVESAVRSVKSDVGVSGGRKGPLSHSGPLSQGSHVGESEVHGNESERVNPFPLALHWSQLWRLVFLLLLAAAASRETSPVDSLNLYLVQWCSQYREPRYWWHYSCELHSANDSVPQMPCSVHRQTSPLLHLYFGSLTGTVVAAAGKGLVLSAVECGAEREEGLDSESAISAELENHHHLHHPPLGIVP